MRNYITSLNGRGWDLQSIWDDGARLVCFDAEQQCCEDARDFVDAPDGFDLDSATFAEPFVEVDVPSNVIAEEWNYGIDEGGAVSWKLVDKHGVEGRLVLGNAHNGFYSHSYVAKQGDTKISEGCL